MSLDSKFASKQIERLSGLSFYPSEAPAIKELRIAGECAASEAILKESVSEWLESYSEAPKPAQLRGIISSKNQETAESLRKCQQCGGCGSITGWYLVTYKGKSFTVKSSTRLREITNHEQATNYLEKLAAFQDRNPDADRQTVLTAARACQCKAYEPEAA